MFKFAFGLTSGIVLGAVGTVAAMVIGIVAIEDSPNLLDALQKKMNES